MLAITNGHPRDQLITFDEIPHIYTIASDPNSKYTSVTTFIHHYFEDFNADQVIKKMMKSAKWPESPYWGKTADEIKELWEQNRILASAEGTEMHKKIESFYNGQRSLDSFLDDPNMQHFVRFYDEYAINLVPYRTEWMIFDTDLKLAGSIDFVTLNDDNDSVSIYDWKRSKEIKRENKWQKGKHPIEHLDDCNYNHYSLQLNLYKALIEKNYNLKVTDLHLVILHPKNESYLIIPVRDMSEEINFLFEHRRKELTSPRLEPHEPERERERDRHEHQGVCLL